MDGKRDKSRRQRRSVRRRAGLTLIELMIAACVLVLASLSLAYAFSSSGLASQQSDRALNVRSALTSTQEAVSDVAYEQLLGWDGTVVQQGDYDVTVAATLVQVGLILVEFTAADARTGMVLSRSATYRSGEY